MPDRTNQHETAAKNGIASLDAVLQHRSRLGACVLLSSADAISFSRLRALLDETDGNLGAQLRKLEDVGYVTVNKQFEERKPVSWYALTPAGRKALKAHLAAMESLIRSADVYKTVKQNVSCNEDPNPRKGDRP